MAERNHFVRHLLEAPEFMRALAGGVVAGLCVRVEALVEKLYELIKEIEPAVSAGMEQVFGQPAVDLHAGLQQIDSTEFEPGEEREQFEALRDFPKELMSEGGG